MPSFELLLVWEWGCGVEAVVDAEAEAVEPITGDEK